MEEKNVQINEQDEMTDDTSLIGQIDFNEILAEIRYWLHKITQMTDALLRVGHCAF